jgi:hypothetical protein
MHPARIADSSHGPAGSSIANQQQVSPPLASLVLDKATQPQGLNRKVMMHRRGWLLFALCLTLHYGAVNAEKEYPSKKAMPPMMDPRPYVLAFVRFRLYRHSPIALVVVVVVLVLVIAGPFRS